MKKILLTTTAFGILAAGSALAEGPTVTVGGYADFQGGYADQEGAYQGQSAAGVIDGTNGSRYSRDFHTRTDTEFHIKVDGKTDGGLGYGAYLELEADVNADDSTSANNNAERNYIYVESMFGRVEAGATGDAGDALRVDASKFARATGGIGGDFYKYVDLSADSAASDDSYYILPGLPTAVGLPGEADIGVTTGDIHELRATANKISYYTPRIVGFQGGISYTPDQGERGTIVGASGGHNQTLENVWNLGLNYDGQFGDVGVEGSVTGEIGSMEDNGNVATTLDDLEAYAGGLAVSYRGFTLGGSYGKVAEYGQASANGEEANYWTAGAAYEFGPFATSVTYLDSTVENQGGVNTPDKDFTNLSVGADYQLAPGLVPYVEVSFFDTDDNVADTATVLDNNGTVLIVGTQLNF